MENYSRCGGQTAVFFDSGAGGLNLLYQCAVRAPQINYYYVSDSKNVPYGNKSADEIFGLTMSALSGIERLNPSVLVVACNTVTALCIERLRQIFSFPVVGIQPAVKQAAKVDGRCIVLATRATVNSPSFRRLLSAYSPPRTQAFGCEGLAAYIEENLLSLPEILPLSLLPTVKADSVVLGCTHYAFVGEHIKKVYGCPVFDGLAGTADHFCEILGMADHFRPQTGICDHSSIKKFKITFYGNGSERNEQVFEYLFGKRPN